MTVQWGWSNWILCFRYKKMLERQRVKREENRSMFAAVLQATSKPFSFYQPHPPERTRRLSSAVFPLSPRDKAELRKQFKANPLPPTTREVSFWSTISSILHDTNTSLCQTANKVASSASKSLTAEEGLNLVQSPFPVNSALRRCSFYQDSGMMTFATQAWLVTV